MGDFRAAETFITDNALHRDSDCRTGVLVSINCSHGGVPKLPVQEALVTADGLAGDRQRDGLFHGGPDRAVTAYSMEIIEALQREGHPISAGSTGENFTLSGLDWNLVAPGAQLVIGGVKLLVTKYCTPCYKIRESFQGGDESRISHKIHPGWSRVATRVLAEGMVRAGDRVTLIPGGE